MMQGTDPQLALDLAKARHAELRAEARRYRLARQARAAPVRGAAAANRQASRSPARVLSWLRG